MKPSDAIWASLPPESDSVYVADARVMASPSPAPSGSLKKFQGVSSKSLPSDWDNKPLPRRPASAAAQTTQQHSPPGHFSLRPSSAAASTNGGLGEQLASTYLLCMEQPNHVTILQASSGANMIMTAHDYFACFQVPVHHEVYSPSEMRAQSLKSARQLLKDCPYAWQRRWRLGSRRLMT